MQRNYLTPDGAKPFDTRDETIHVKDAADVKITARATRHGPVLSDVSKEFAAVAGPNQAVALSFTGLSGDDTTFEAILKIDAAHNWDEFREGLKLVFAPMQNIVYADVNGEIGLIAPGHVPVRKSGDGLSPTSGATGATDWTGFVPFDDMPQVHNPQVGFLFNANNALVPDSQDAMFGRDWEEPFRARRLQQFFDRIEKHSLETSAEMQADHVSPDALDFLALLKAMKPGGERARQAQQLLSGWNGVFDQDKPEPLIYSAFLLNLHRILLDERLGFTLGDDGPFSATTLLSLVKNHPQWCDEKEAKDAPNSDCMKAIARAFDEGLAMLVQRDGADMSHWRWGTEHVAELTHKVYSHVPLLDRVSNLSMPSSGGFYTLDRGGGFEEPEGMPFARTQGGGFRGIYDLSDLEKSRFMITTGKSGHIFSPHYGDLAPLWINVKSITITGGEDALKAAGARELTLTGK